MHKLKGKKILLGITGGIAAYKIPELIRLLTQAGAIVKTVLTDSAEKFVTPLTLQTVSNQPVYTSLWEAENTISHIELARWADVIIIAPATANSIAKLAHGFSDDVLTTLCLATKTQIILVPAMNTQMYLNPITQKNIRELYQRGFIFWGPEEGIQACGETGFGRMCEPEVLFNYIENYFSPISKKIFANKSILIAAGPTQEALDPIRFLTNYSSGKMGYALAEAALALGAKVTLISGPTNLSISSEINKIKVISTEEMAQAVLDNIKNSDIFISAAAICDYKSEVVSPNKIKKTSDTFEIKLTKTPDILKNISERCFDKKPLMIGFAAETEDVIANAQQKLVAKKLDMIIANQVGKDIGFNSDENQVSVITRDHVIDLPRAPKKQLAVEILGFINEIL